MKDFKVLFPYIKKNWWLYLIGFVGLVFVDGIQLYIPQIQRKAIDGLTFGTVNELDLLKYGLLIFLLGLGIGVTRFFWRYAIIGASRKLELDVRNHFYKHVMSLSSKWFDRSKIGDIMALATNDLESIRMFFGIGFVGAFDALLLGLATLVLMFSMDVKLTLLSLIPLPVLSIILIKMGPVLHKRTKLVQDAFSDLTDKTREIFSGIRVVKAYSQEDSELENFAEINKDYLKKNMSMVVLWGFFDPLIGTVIGFAFGIFLLVGGRTVIMNNMTMGSFTAFMSYLGQLSWPMIAIGMVFNMYKRAGASMTRLNEILNVKPDIVDSPDAKDPDNLTGKIEIKNLSFAYNDAKVLDDISLTVNPGDFIAIVGRTGSGKSTLMNIIPRLYDPPANTVFLDGYDIRDLKLERLRKTVGTVSQETFLFSESIAENILFSNPDKDKDQAIECAKIAQIHEQIMEFPRGYDEEIGERGVSLSGGQKQRISIARTLLKDPKVLILDDALSAVDTEIENKILDGLNQYFGKVTVLLISHRISTVMKADKIYVIDKGKIVEEGNHEELLNLNGIYAEINILQALEEELLK